jgi:hypothetical protein
MMTLPAFAETAQLVRRFAGHGSHVVIAADTRLEHDLGITGADGAALLEEVSRHFNVALAGPDGYRSTFGLGPNEYLFHSEGLDLLGLGVLIDRVLRRPRSTVRDLKVGDLHEAVCRVRRLASGAAAPATGY